MTDATLFLPVLIILSGAVAALALGLSPLRQRLSSVALGWSLALFPLASFMLSASVLPILRDGTALSWQFDWLPALELTAGFYVDSLSALFMLLVTGIGVLVTIYAGYYFKGDNGAWRFFTYLLLFMSAMTGLVMAGDVITLFIFWEGTSILSYLLVAYKFNYPEARAGAFRALFITGGGGIALLAGLLTVSYVAGGSDMTTILQSGELVRSSELYGVMLTLVAFGAFTKSAQFPAHIWLPGAMSAPTPASAYLHSATMVKAGVYLLARLNPTLGNTEAWFWLLTVVGGLTMLTGAYLGLKQNDLKALLAYSTISQLGVFVMMIGQEMDIAFKALVVGVVAHALYKSALFMLAGIVDHETGTRDITRLGGLRRVMPMTFGLATLGALSMAGLPPLFGFLAKETLLATAVHPTFTVWESYLLVAATVAAGALLLAQSALLIFETFLGRAKDNSINAHEAPRGMLLAPAVPVLLSLVVSIPDAQFLETFLANAAAAAFGDKVKVSLALWTGFNVPLLLSGLAISIGLVLTWQRQAVRSWQNRIGRGISFDHVYTGALAGLDWLAYAATRLQRGRLRFYLQVMLLSLVLLVFVTGGIPVPDLSTVTWPAFDFDGELALLRLAALVVTVGAALASVLLRRDIAAIIAFGASGLAVAVLMALEPAPDVALVQVVVDILALVILVLALTRLPRPQRRRAQEFTFAQSRKGLVWDALVAGALGLIVTAVTFTTLVSRPRESVVTPFYAANAKPLTGAKDIVGAIIVDFRALDTLIEIAVFSMAGLGVYTLLTYATRKHKDMERSLDHEQPVPARALKTLGIGGYRTSSFIRALAYFSLPFSLVIALIHVMYGHDQPGDGFTAGVIVSLAIGFWYVVFGYREVRQRLFWLRAAPLIGFGLLLVIVSGTTAALMNGSFLSPVDFGQLLGLPLPEGLNLSTSLLFEAAICLVVMGSVAYMLNTLGRPGETDAESRARQQLPLSIDPDTVSAGYPAPTPELQPEDGERASVPQLEG